MHLQGYCVRMVQCIYISAMERYDAGTDGWRQQLQQWSVPASALGLLDLEAELVFKRANTCLASDFGQLLYHVVPG